MFKVGDRVRVRSYDEIEKTLYVDGILIDDTIYFCSDMKDHCGQVFDVIYIFDATEKKSTSHKT